MRPYKAILKLPSWIPATNNGQAMSEGHFNATNQEINGCNASVVFGISNIYLCFKISALKILDFLTQIPISSSLLQRYWLTVETQVQTWDGQRNSSIIS